jgi:hypothetical protein
MINIRHILRKRKTKKEKRETLNIKNLEIKAVASRRLISNFLRKIDKSININADDTFNSGLIYNYVQVYYRYVNLRFTLYASGKIIIRIKKSKLTTNVIYDDIPSEKIKLFLNENAKKIQN